MLPVWDASEVEEIDQAEENEEIEQSTSAPQISTSGVCDDEMSVFFSIIFIRFSNHLSHRSAHSPWVSAEKRVHKRDIQNRHQESTFSKRHWFVYMGMIKFLFMYIRHCRRNEEAADQARPGAMI